MSNELVVAGSAVAVISVFGYLIVKSGIEAYKEWSSEKGKSNRAIANNQKIVVDQRTREHKTMNRRNRMNPIVAGEEPTIVAREGTLVESNNIDNTNVIIWYGVAIILMLAVGVLAKGPMQMTTGVLVKVIDPINASIAIALVFTSRKWWVILFATLVSAFVTELILTNTQYLRTFGEGFIYGFPASMSISYIVYMIRNGINRVPKDEKMKDHESHGISDVKQKIQKVFQEQNETTSDPVTTKLKILKNAFENDLITEDEYQSKKTTLLEEL